MKKIKFSFIVPLAPLIFLLLIGMPLSCTNGDFFESLLSIRSTEITFYDENPLESSGAKSATIQCEIDSTININSSYPKDLKSGYVPTGWKYVDINSKSESLPKNVTVVDGKIEDIHITQRALCFYAEGWMNATHEHTFSSDWESDDTNHWHICESCGAKSEKIAHSASEWKNDGDYHWKICDVCGKEFSKAAHDWTSGDTCVCGKVQSTEVAIADLITYLSDESLKGTTPSVTVKADSDSDISSIKTALQDESVTSNVAGVDLVLTTDNLTSLPSSAFQYCTSLTSVTIPERVTTIGNYAFGGCTALSSVTILEGVESIGERAFDGCTALSSVTIPEGVKTIGSSAFSGCTSLTSVTIPEGVTSIGSYTFSGCTALSSVTIPDGVKSIGKYAFRGCTALSSVTIPSSVTSIGEAAFRGCTKLVSIDVESGNAKYASDDGVLFNKEKTKLIRFPCGKSGDYTIPSSVTTIGGSAFYGCTSLTSMTIPESVTTIGEDAFYGCTSLASVTIPEGVKTIGSSAFSGCTSLTSVTIPEGVKEIGAHAFTGCTSLESVTIPDGVTTIGGSAFNDCTSLTSVTIPESVTTIGDYAFDECTALSSVTIPGSVTEIGSSTFYGCKSLTSVTIPKSVTTIRDYAFQACESLTSVTVEATTPPKLGSTSVFGNNASSRKIYVPADSVEAYKAAENWSFYEEYIVAIQTP